MTIKKPMKAAAPAADTAAPAAGGATIADRFKLDMTEPEKKPAAGGKATTCAVAAGLVALGLLMAFCFGKWSLPVNKPVWSSSFALVAGGISAALLALFYWIVDICGWRRWGFFFKVIGMNAIACYLMMRTVFNWQFESVYFFGGISKHLSPEVGAFVTQAGMIALGWLLLYWLYRKDIFLRV